MNGVEILTSKEVVVSTTFNWNAFWITVVISIVAMFVIGLIIKHTGGGDWATVVILTCVAGSLFGTMFGTLFGYVFNKGHTYETRYKCIVSDEVSMAEFMEKYEVIDKDGKLYTVRERD